jgi:hypothetical protein
VDIFGLKKVIEFLWDESLADPFSFIPRWEESFRDERLRSVIGHGLTIFSSDTSIKWIGSKRANQMEH